MRPGIFGDGVKLALPSYEPIYGAISSLRHYPIKLKHDFLFAELASTEVSIGHQSSWHRSMLPKHYKLFSLTRDGRFPKTAHIMVHLLIVPEIACISI